MSPYAGLKIKDHAHAILQQNPISSFRALLHQLRRVGPLSLTQRHEAQSIRVAHNLREVEWQWVGWLLGLFGRKFLPAGMLIIGQVRLSMGFEL